MSTQHDLLMQDAEFRKLLAVESLSAEAAELIAGLMVERGMSKADLARALNKSRAWVTQLLSGRTNMTVRTLAEVAHTLGGEVRVVALPAAQVRAVEAAPAKVHNFQIRNVVLAQTSSAAEPYHLRQQRETGGAGCADAQAGDAKGSECAA